MIGPFLFYSNVKIARTSLLYKLCTIQLIASVTQSKFTRLSTEIGDKCELQSWLEWAEWMAWNFHRSSSAVDGRNGRGLTEKRLNGDA